ncbi:conserved hypothetical protein [Histoplasma capsulatum var. duboisii H88]|uniref:Protein required for cell viability Rrp17 n=1 Tax=Ajellomyces capsulatus (strain H88) TaxID=544711 RepID=F0UC43_AJEC8|nr:conserved hypothetical protein [Histoplasma capsulatum var. duboisii H88]QSS50148.1 hypothetical protein I7I53_10731 [Histoplasma capsulatum var. duboisii H88]
MAPSAKRRKLTASHPNAVQEILFDPQARAEFLTGFHKRKLERAKQAQENAEKRSKEEKKEQRRRMRDERRAEFERALAENRSLMREISRAAAAESSSDEGGETNDNIIIDEEWGGITELPPVDYEAEYIDEDKYTTVTVEELDASSREGLRRRVDVESSDEGESGDDGKTRNEVEEGGREDGGDTWRVKKRAWTKNKSKNTNVSGDGDKNNISDRPKSNSKKKKRSFRYENKAERRVAKLKERAGGKKRARERKAGA